MYTVHVHDSPFVALASCFFFRLKSSETVTINNLLPDLTMMEVCTALDVFACPRKMEVTLQSIEGPHAHLVDCCALSQGKLQQWL